MACHRTNAHIPNASSQLLHHLWECKQHPVQDFPQGVYGKHLFVGVLPASFEVSYFSIDESVLDG